MGPALDGVGKKYDARQLLETIINPSAKVEEEFKTFQLATVEGQVLTGRILRRDVEQLVFITNENKRRSFQTSEVAELKPSDKSLMPDQLLQSLSPQEAADLIAFLQALR